VTGSKKEAMMGMSISVPSSRLFVRAWVVNLIGLTVYWVGSERLTCEVTCKGIGEVIGQGSLEEESHNFSLTPKMRKGHLFMLDPQ
jgi:hypothetical protein